MYICAKISFYFLFFYMYIRHVPLGTCCVSRSPVCRELHPQLEFYEFPGGVGSSRWRWELQPLPLKFLKGGDPRLPASTCITPSPLQASQNPAFPPSAASCALVRQPWRQDVQTSPKIAKTTPSWSQHLPK